MKIEHATGQSGRRSFQRVGKMVYRELSHYRGTERDVEKLVTSGKSAFHTHAIVRLFLLREANDLIGRFALIHDRNLPHYIQVSFFEALPGLSGLMEMIRAEAIRLFPQCKKLVVGLNGHLNYSAGFLLNCYNEPPVFGLPYTPDYYPGYFTGLKERRMVSFRFPMQKVGDWLKASSKNKIIEGITARCMDKKHLRRDCALYTYLNNTCFMDHPFWSNRTEDEDLELFHPYRFLLDESNLIFAEHKGRVVGFLLWYPDLNQLVSTQRGLNIFDLLRFRLHNPIDTFRLTEIGVLPEYRKKAVSYVMMQKALPYILEAGYSNCEGGFIFEENQSSIALTTRILKGAFNKKIEPYRYYAVYEGTL